MTATATRPGDPSSPVAPSATGDRTMQRLRSTAVWVVVLLLGGLALAYAAGRPAPDDYLHPDGTGQTGSRALVEVLRDQGIEVVVADTAGDALDAGGDAAGTTLVVGNSELLTEAAARRLLDGARDADHLVLLDAAPGVLDSLGLGLEVGPPVVEPESAGCEAPWVRPDDRLERVSFTVVPADDALPAGAVGCYRLEADIDRDVPEVPEDQRPPSGFAAVDLPATATRPAVTVVGFPDAATNRFVTEADHAGLVVRLLGASPRLVWYHPTAEDLTENPPSAEESQEVWPAWTAEAVILLGVAFVVFALARGRRLGRLVPEPLPVLVRAAETTEDRSRLYRAAGDRGRAAAVLRSATAGRLAARLGLARGAPVEDVVRAAATASGSDPSAVDALLRGPAPADEAALVTLAQQLTRLEEKVSTP